MTSNQPSHVHPDNNEYHQKLATYLIEIPQGNKLSMD
jgi:hypothetical protein